MPSSPATTRPERVWRERLHAGRTRVLRYISGRHGGRSKDLRYTGHAGRSRDLLYFTKTAVIAFFILLAASVVPARADVVTASWNFNPEPDVTGYILSHGPVPGSPYATNTDVGNMVTTSVTLSPGSVYYFAVRAYNSGGGISAYSAEVVVDLTTAVLSLSFVADQNTQEGKTASLQLDGTGNPLTYGATGLPPGLSVNPSSGLITGFLGFLSSGSHVVTATASDGVTTVNRVFAWTVQNRAPGVTVANDFDGDLKTDISVYRGVGFCSSPNPSVCWSILRSGSSNTLIEIPWGAPTDLPVPGDYDGDAVTDLAVFRPSTGMWWVLQSSTNFATFATYVLGSSNDRVAPADYDGDGKTDPAVFHPLAVPPAFEILTSASGYVARVTIVLGSSYDRPVPGDYDGDGKADVAVYANSGQWTILQSSTNNATSLTANWGGLRSDQPVPGDYDGDGKSDIAIYRPWRPAANGTWYILQSSSGFTASFTVVLGLHPNDLPVPGDYEGDRRTDVAIYHPATTGGVWTVRTSSSNYTSGPAPVTLGTPIDRPVPNIIVTPLTPISITNGTRVPTAPPNTTAPVSVTWGTEPKPQPRR